MYLTMIQPNEAEVHCAADHHGRGDQRHDRYEGCPGAGSPAASVRYHRRGGQRQLRIHEAAGQLEPRASKRDEAKPRGVRRVSYYYLHLTIKYSRS